MNKRLRTILQYLFFLGFGIFLAWLSLKNLDKEKTAQIKDAFRNARHWLIIPVFIMLFAGHLVRALRWKLLMEPMGYQPATLNTFFAVMIGYLTNQAFPRLGEVLKCTVLARYEKIPADKLIGTIIIERIIDAITLLVVFGITLLIQPHLYAEMMEALFHTKQEPGESGVSGKLIGLLIVAALLITLFAWVIIKKKTFSDVKNLVKMIGQRIVMGISSVRQLKKRGLFLLYTLILWSIYLFGGYIGFLALQDTEHYGIREAFTVLSAGSIGMIASPGGIGAYAYLIQETMKMYGLREVIALAFGWILWLAQTAVIIIGGIISFAAIPHYNKKRIRHEKA
jgi:glycosyltransferase 2 family protein